MKRFLLSLMLIMLAACASNPRVTTDYNSDVDFAKIKSYSWLVLPQGVSPLVQSRIVSTVDAQLQARGWQRLEGGAGEVTVAAHVIVRQQTSIDTLYTGPAFTGWGWHDPWRHGPAGRRSMGMTTTNVRTVDVGTLVVDMFLTQGRQAIWRGTGDRTVPSNPQRLNEVIQAGIENMFRDFPPTATPAG
jgi:hypothetical protein